MSFEEFQNRSRLYVIGALETEELDEFEQARKQFGQKGEDFIGECYALHEAFALSLRPVRVHRAAGRGQGERLSFKRQFTWLADTKYPARFEEADVAVAVINIVTD